MNINSLISEIIESTPSLVKVSCMLDKSYPQGYVGVSGYFDDTDCTIGIVLVSNKDSAEEFSFIDKDAIKFYNDELHKTLKHEMVHMKQLLSGKSFKDIPSSRDEEKYYSSDLEIEAYGRADVYLELKDKGHSETLDTYIDLFGEDSKIVKKVVSFSEEERNNE